MEKIRMHAAGIDIGSRKVFVATDGPEVRNFGTFTCDFNLVARYLLDCGVDTVAMEATGVYWATLYEILGAAGLDVWLVDGRETRQAPGRKTDVKDCQWIQQLHSHGLLKRCFVATGLAKELRGYQRLREDHIRTASMHVNHMQKALIGMNVRLPEVLSQVHGKSGMAIIEAILDGERDRHRLLALCHKSILDKKSDEVLKALEGHYTGAGLFALRQAHDAYLFYQAQIEACDREIAAVLEKLGGDGPPPPAVKAGKRKPVRHNAPRIDNLGGHLLRMSGGRDATVLSGVTDYTWLQLLAEMGTDLGRWPSEKHFTSWLGLSPGQADSGKRKKNARKKGSPRGGMIFRTIARSLVTSKHLAWGAFARRLRGRKGPAIAIKATARKLAEQYWRLMVKGSDYVEKGVASYEAQVQQQKQRLLARLARELNVSITPT